MSRPARIHARFLALAAVLAAACCGLWSSAVAAAETVVFVPTGAEQTFVVPANVSSIRAIAIGGKGAAGASGGAGGFGAMASADLAVTPGQTLYLEVGGNASGVAGGFNGGAPGGTGGNNAGGGGGASDIRTAPRAAGVSLNLRLIVAGGGGGGGGGQGTATKTNQGGNGGQVAGAGGNDYGAGGGAGTGVAGGAGGSGCDTGQSGSPGTGGAGGPSTCGPGGGGGGGGGGVFGGGGGGGSSAGGGGGAGASGFGPGATNTSVVTDITGGPSILLTYTPGLPTPPVVDPVATAQCVVPNLSGRKLKGARKALRNKSCKVGKVTRRTPRAKKVVAQSPKPGKKLPAGTKVNVTLGGGSRR